MGSGGSIALWSLKKFNGASTQIRTGDLTLTKGALYQLSHTSTQFCYEARYYKLLKFEAWR